MRMGYGFPGLPATGKVANLASKRLWAAAGTLAPTVIGLGNNLHIHKFSIWSSLLLYPGVLPKRYYSVLSSFFLCCICFLYRMKFSLFLTRSMNFTVIPSSYLSPGWAITSYIFREGSFLPM